jgi:2-isopropylmalate synthase
MKKDRIIIFDTTLRDGEQSPGASLTPKDKLEIAFQLESLGVDALEAGFPISSPGDFKAVSAVAKNLKKPIVCGLARSIKKDIDKAYDAVRHAKRPRIHVFLATSKIHMKYKLKKAEEEIIKIAEWAVKYARKKVDDVEFSPEDASRTQKDFLYRVVETVIRAGARTVNIPDTVGYAVPTEFGSLIGGIKNNVPNINKCVISVHCHNDLGLGVANYIAAVENGARQVECTINGIGERAGNASLEEIVMSLATRGDVFGKTTGINKKEIYKTSKLVSKLTGIIVQPNKAVVGGNAFSHEAGIHQDGILKKRSTYEIMRPKDVGFGESRLVLGKHSGGHAFKERLKKLGYHLNQKELEKALKRFKALADKKKSVFDDDLIAIVEDELVMVPEIYKLGEFKVVSGNMTKPRATVSLSVKRKIKRATSGGDGPVDACYKAIDKITGMKIELMDYSLKAVTHGKDALGEVTVKVKSKGKVVASRGASTDIVESSIKAYVNAMNKLSAKKTKGLSYSL